MRKADQSVLDRLHEQQDHIERVRGMVNPSLSIDTKEDQHYTVRCNDCWWHGNEEGLELAVAADYPDDEPAKVCPNCKKLGCLMDLEGANHIADARKMVTPLAKRKIQSKIDEGEYRYLKGATVLVNEHGRAAIVNHGGAFYWVENADMYVEFHRAETQFEPDHIPDIGKMVPEGWRLVPVEPDQALLVSMATCLNHGFGLLTKEKQDGQLYDMRKLYDEVVGKGYYSPKTRERYLAMLAASPKHTGEQ